MVSVLQNITWGFLLIAGVTVLSYALQKLGGIYARLGDLRDNAEAILATLKRIESNSENSANALGSMTPEAQRLRFEQEDKQRRLRLGQGD
jgi:hypothetical protein